MSNQIKPLPIAQGELSFLSSVVLALLYPRHRNERSADFAACIAEFCPKLNNEVGYQSIKQELIHIDEVFFLTVYRSAI